MKEEYPEMEKRLKVGLRIYKNEEAENVIIKMHENKLFNSM